MPAFTAVPVAPTVYWVGAIDWNLREFHGYRTSRGTTYNAYLILADKVALIDTVKAPFRDEFLARVASVLGGRQIDYLISLHAEMDHSGCLPEAVRALQPRQVLASKKGVAALQSHFGESFAVSAVPEGGLALGGATLQFIDTGFLHWPESMVAYLVEQKLLISQDAYGMHYASAERFADELPPAAVDYEAIKYYANILLPLAVQIKKATERVVKSGIEIQTIAPDHGPIWRRHATAIMQRYDRWADQAPTRKALVVYDSMWGSTAVMARAIGEGLGAGGAEVKVLSLAANHRSDIVTELLEAGALLLGSPTINDQYYPTLGDLLCYLKGLKPRNLVGGCFGSYGWSAKGVKNLEAEFEALGLPRVGESPTVKYVPTAADLEACRDYGRQVAAALLATLAK